ncbi:GAF domain-containing sensor histidine kinase [Halobacillus locisalis]|uniref:Oxygen sensor histidine kinase NreB n=1 Tax=Halobacillus locisalis TaxID=220753 RepID=A0A838CX83_9BACI|nr:GAF domain-containing protein [Halobacillus locisalis]MBA2176375.1 GAF domain-containing sensor histidine kinase [Halobacillus locisalis]
MAAEEHELRTLQLISETLNQSNDLRQMMQTVLEKLLSITKLESGWMFLTDERPHYTMVADYQLPESLAWENKKPMCSGSCYCLNKYWNDELKDPINIIECKRLDDAVRYSWGSTNGITHHATIPLVAGEEAFGVLNVASPGKTHFDEEELILLQSVAYQIGTAIKRTRLFEAQQQRADNFAKLNEVIRLIWKAQDHATLIADTIKKMEDVYSWPYIGFFSAKGSDLVLHSQTDALRNIERIHVDHECEVTEAFKKQETIRTKQNHSTFLNGVSSIVLPLTVKEERIGLLYVGSRHRSLFSDSDVEVLEALASHLSLAFESIHLQEKRQEVLLYEERNRLARDLHDSVNQKLFSLSLTARGAKEVIPKEDQVLRELLTDMQTLSQDSMKEMKSLIWQLRPVGVEDGLLSTLTTYGRHLGMELSFDVEDIPHLAHATQEALWRISQESLNNVRKHAETNQASIRLKALEGGAELSIVDRGKGFQSVPHSGRALGLTSMKERAELLGGTFHVESQIGRGTTVTVFVPWMKKGEQ